MEIRLRPLVAALIVVMLLGGLGCFAWPRLAPVVAPLWPWPAATATSAVAPVAVQPGGPEVTYLDQSLGWDWEVACAPQLQRFLADRLPGQHIAAVQIALVDYKLDSQLPFGTVYRAARATGDCFNTPFLVENNQKRGINQQGAFTCQVAVAGGEPGPDLDVAVTLNAPYTLLDMFLARGANPDDIRKTWSMATFQPLLAPAEETNRWQSSCLQLSRAR